MSAVTAKSNSVVDRLAPFVIVVVIVTMAYVSYIQPQLTQFLRDRNDVTTLDVRVRTLQDVITRASGQKAPDEKPALAAFEERVSADDKVADVVEFMAKAAVESTPKERLRALSVETGDTLGVDRGAGAGGRASSGSGSDQIDPRVGLFPVPVRYTPVTVSFESTYEAIASFVGKIRNLPTTVEIRSATLTRGVPLMKIELTVWVYQRVGAAVDQPVGPFAPGPAPGIPPGIPTVPRVAQVAGAEGLDR